MAKSPMVGIYDHTIDRESAYETLLAKAQTVSKEVPPPVRRHEPTMGDQAGKVIGAMATSVVRSAGTQIGRQLVRGLLGGLFRGR